MKATEPRLRNSLQKSGQFITPICHGTYSWTLKHCVTTLVKQALDRQLYNGEE